MNLRYLTCLGAISAFVAGGALLAPPQAAAQEELTRGPVHEAFATSVNYNPEPGIVVSVAPPEAIEEIPPDQRPDGENVAWIPGYWSWDDEQNDFIWISGIWRNLPPDRQWVPGYWGQVDNEWQWTSGYWSGEDEQEVVYLSEPPKSIETGPNVEAPSDNYIWVSGTWVDRDDRYAWRPGYWQPAQENWTWVPAHYQWTRRGYVFVDGYWDYDVQRRGTVFAPVRFQDDYYRRPDYYYTPSTVIAVNVFLTHLFVRPNYNHYYFGDYYEPRYRDRGYYDPYAYRSGRRGYDPIFEHYRWEHRHEKDWDRKRRDDFDFYRDNKDARPPHTWALMRALPEKDRKGRRDNFEFAQPLNQYVSNKDNGQRFKSVSKDEKEKFIEQRKELKKFSKDRQVLENRAAEKRDKDDKRVRVQSEKIEKSPFVSKRADQLTGKDAPPKRPEGRGNSDKKDGRDGNKSADDQAAKLPENRDGKDKENRDGKDKENRDGKDKENRDGRDKGNGEGKKAENANADPNSPKRPDQNGNGQSDRKGDGKDKEDRDQKNPVTPRNEDKKDRNPEKESRQIEKKAPQPEREPKKETQPTREPKKEVQPERAPKKEVKQREPEAPKQPKVERKAEPKVEKTQPPKVERKPDPKPQPQPQRQAAPEKKEQPRQPSEQPKKEKKKDKGDDGDGR